MYDVTAERRRQVEKEGWTAGHDDAHRSGELAHAAACYATQDCELKFCNDDTVWPWESHWWKPKDYRRDLVRAAALLLAEIERIDRATDARAERAEPIYYECPN